ncbi:MAG: hypothetical protein SCALA702_17920 [Melioribacteraceae bacterium]|nr:MAG: hypothetical protein SCALA702_17920 [Melioribacteraceae bacterium]
MKKNILLILLLLFSGALYSQNNAPLQEEKYVPNQLIIMLDLNKGADNFANEMKEHGLTPVKLLSRRMNIWLYEYSNNKATDKAILSDVMVHKDVKIAQFNHYVQLRESVDASKPFNKNDYIDMIPNDPSFNLQWALNNTGQTGGTPDADIDAVEAWDLSFGGVTATGDEVVIAVIDGGADINHEDISYWKNVHEIPNNNIDDDNNGYIDDYDGWDAYESDGSIPSSSHGTHVAGIAAAVGNNGIGVSGVNPNAKIMPIAGSSSVEATVVEAYGYVHEMRSRYNETNGQYGAFVVVTNASFGVDYGDPSDYPIWCAMYDSLGSIGVLNCGATANLNIDVDIQGDVPTACPSDYMVAVTNTTDTDQKNSGAAYGLTTIDLGAPGTAIYNAIPGNSYGNKTGTSMATPTVAGAIALMYSAANQTIMEAYKNDPAAYALIFKQHLFDNVDPIPALDGITVTGGRLNIYNSLLMVIEEPDQVPPSTVTDLMVIDQTSSSLALGWTAPFDTSRNGVVAYDLRWSENPVLNDTDFENANMLSYSEAPADSGEAEVYMIEGLDFSTTYHFAIKSSDIWGNVSGLSNNAEGMTWGAPEASVDPMSISVNLDPMSSTTESFNLANVSFDNSTMDFTIELANNNFPSSDALKVKLIPKVNAIESTKGTKNKPIEFGGVGFRGAGGPDLFGYEWIDSNEPDGPEYEWNDISTTGTAASNWTPSGTFDPEDEGYAGPFDLGFNFKYYGETYDEIYVGSNGFLTFFEFSGNTYSNSAIPSSSVPNGIIAAFWDDLDGSEGGTVFYKQEGNKFIVQYDQWPRFYGQPGQDYTFQIVLHSSGKVMFYYEAMTDGVNSASVGIEDHDGLDGLQIVQNGVYIEDGLAVKFSAEPDWLASDTMEGTIYNGSSVDVELSFISEDFPEGDYSMDVVITTTDPDNSEIIIPVTMTIGEGGTSDSWATDILVADAGGVEVSNTLTFGQDPTATEGIDASLDEFELPPLPPAGVFDSRFNLPGNVGSLVDLRNSSEEAITWNIGLQAGSAGYPVTLSWNPDNLPDGMFMLKDPFGGSIITVDMKTESSVEITNSSITDLVIEYADVMALMIDVSTGWNIVSAPMDMDDMSVSAVYPGAVSQAFGFDNGYYTVNTCVPGYGYWVKFDGADQIEMLGQPTGDDVPVKEGWNLIGPMEYEMMVSGIGTNPSGLLTSPFYEFSSGYGIAESLMPGHGYWVKASGNGVLTYSNKAAKSGVPKNEITSSASLVLTDAAGNTTKLLLGANLSNSEYFELPPLPPSQVFDVRFSSNKVVESSVSGEIKMQGLEYPVTISAEGSDITLQDNLGGILLNASLKAGEQIVIADTRINSMSVSSVEIPTEFTLGQNYPNPFNPSTTINFALPVDAKVTVSLYNMLGEKVNDIVAKEFSAGSHEVKFNASQLASGMYIYTVSANGADGRTFSDTKKMMLMK